MYIEILIRIHSSTIHQSVFISSEKRTHYGRKQISCHTNRNYRLKTNG